MQVHVAVAINSVVVALVFTLSFFVLPRRCLNMRVLDVDVET